MDNRKWVIITLADYTNEQLQELVNSAIQTSIQTLRKSLDNTMAILKWDGDIPSVFNSMTIYNHNQILTILKGSDWSDSSGI